MVKTIQTRTKLTHRLELILTTYMLPFFIGTPNQTKLNIMAHERVVII